MKRVLYVPLDDRPVNIDDVIVQGKSAGIDVITPNAHDIKNRLDSEKTVSGSTVTSTSSPTFGKVENIYQFILDKAECVDGFIISIDMLVYGGLIGSRRLRPGGCGDYPLYDSDTTYLLDVIRHLKQDYPSKPIFVLDTIMRLATTSYADGLWFEAYQESRSLMQQPRKQATSFIDIVNGYDIKPDGTTFEDTIHFNKEHYYNTRRHKLQTTYYLLDQFVKEGLIDFLSIGVDDAYTEGVQANEIAWVENYVNTWLGGKGGQNPDRVIILPDADGLGHSLLARMADYFYHCGKKRRYKVDYYGPHGSTITNPYEYMNVHENMIHHIDIIGGEYVENGEFDLDVIAITDPEEIDAVILRLEANGVNQKPTMIIDFTSGGAGNETVTLGLLSSAYTGRLLGYSAWNTAGNKMGLSLGMGQARYAFLTSGTKDEALLDWSLKAHGSLLFKRFLKDYDYKAVTIAEIRDVSRNLTPYTNVTSDQNMQLFNTANDFEEITVLLQERLIEQTESLAGQNAFSIGVSSESFNVRKICGDAWQLIPYTWASLEREDAYFTWRRAFEITVKPSVSFGC
ncbi:DUF4127 family protein [Caldalkalibacillus horti]|uniref:DUF4127 family protein n=1 Tax=Caldalkalibacillus horti TaxID=77523 RepID=A0ABT9W369_9BACI|nr:DUF4127 family protein [Bacillus horti]MDQ0167684.1 hypothetical protein [Bacillus horti]